MNEHNGLKWAGWKWAALAWVAAGVLATAALDGCGPDAPAAAGPVRGDVTDIRPLGRPAVPASPAAVGTDPLLYDTSGPLPVVPQPVTESAAPVVVATARSTPDAAAPTPPPVPHPPRRTHVVRRGETLFAIARTTYGDGSKWHRLADANPAAASAPLRVGQQIVVP